MDKIGRDERIQEILLVADRLADKLVLIVDALEGENAKMREFYTAALQAHEKLLNRTSVALMEKNIRALLAEEEARQARTEKYAKKHNWGGVSPEILK